MKQCSKCKESKLLTEFTKDNRLKSGYAGKCKACTNKTEKTCRENNSVKYKATKKAYYDKNIIKIRAGKVINSKKFKGQKSAYDKIYREQNKERIAEYKKAWEHTKKDDPIFKIKRNLRRRVHHALNSIKKADNTFALIGCTPNEFKLHIEAQFVDGMSWGNYGRDTWHVDHIIPCYSYDLTQEDQQRECFHYTNQRPLWSVDNLSRPRDIY
tara:strand:+ start:87 stop:722 length:636 start_codon:yes stop_codon:yes gene_type:complete